MSKETPQSQHAAAAKKILEKRAAKEPKPVEAKDPECLVLAPAERIEQIDMEIIVLENERTSLIEEIDKLEHEASVNGVDNPGKPYTEMTKKELKIECDAAGISYEKKETNEALIAKLDNR